jgi:hypothetical protein
MRRISARRRRASSLRAIALGTADVALRNTGGVSGHLGRDAVSLDSSRAVIAASLGRGQRHVAGCGNGW